MPTDDEETKARLELARIAFDEVLDATKHQDDKIGRFLTAIAFLTTGAIALLFGGEDALVAAQFEVTQRSDLLPDTSPLIAWTALGFFTCILASVAMLLLTLAAPLRLPGRRLDHGKRLEGSRIFFSYIAEEPADVWEERWDQSPAQTRAELAEHYVLETHNLAERARTKHGHTSIAASLFILALLFLGLAIVLALTATVNEGQQPVQSSWTLAAGVAMIASLHSVIQLYARYAHDRRSFQLARDAGRGGMGSEAGKKFLAAGSTKWLFVSVPMFIVGVAWPGPEAQRCFGFTMVIVALLVSFGATRPRWDEARLRNAIGRIVVYGIAPLVLACAALLWTQTAQLVVAVLPAVALSLNSIRVAVQRDIRNVNEAKQAGEASVPPEKVGSIASNRTTGEFSGDAETHGDSTA